MHAINTISPENASVRIFQAIEHSPVVASIRAAIECPAFDTSATAIGDAVIGLTVNRAASTHSVGSDSSDHPLLAAPIAGRGALLRANPLTSKPARLAI